MHTVLALTTKFHQPKWLLVLRDRLSLGSQFRHLYKKKIALLAYLTRELLAIVTFIRFLSMKIVLTMLI
jgi:hypothetical protein